VGKNTEEGKNDVEPAMRMINVSPAIPETPEHGELETEGLGLMAQDMGHQCWGTPHLEIRHARW